MEAEKRLEPVSYEAEWAYLPCYDDLGKKSKPIVYVPAPDCSGRMKISRLGGREENFADSPSQLVGDTIAETKRVVMADADIAVHDKNKEIIARLYSKGFFKLKNSVVECAEALGISKNTVYLHIRSCKNT